jgi:AraC-like DNA-binding protein
MSLVAALICDSDTRKRLRMSLSDRSRIEFCSRAPELLDVALRRSVHLILTELRDSSGALLTPTVRRLHSQFATIPILACCSLTPGVSAELLDLMHAGISGIVFRGLDDIGQALRSALDCVDDRCLASTVTAAAVDAAGSPEGRMIIAYCIENARTAPTVAQMAGAIGVSRKTLVNWMRRAHLPPPRATICWCRILLAARLLAASGRSVESVALELGFGSGTELRNMLRRYTHLRPREIRGYAGFQQVLTLFMREGSGCATSSANDTENIPYKPIPIALPGLPLSQRRTV